MVDVAVKRLSLRSGRLHKARHRGADHVERRTCRVHSSAAQRESSIWDSGPQRMEAASSIRMAALDVDLQHVHLPY